MLVLKSLQDNPPHLMVLGKSHASELNIHHDDAMEQSKVKEAATQDGRVKNENERSDIVQNF